MNNLLKRLNTWLWHSHGSQNRAERRLLLFGRYVYSLTHDLFEGQISMRAMGLVYTTLLSLVPILALAFSVLKALGAHDTLAPMLLEFLSPLGNQAQELTNNILGFVEKMKVGVLGSLGVSLLLYSAISLIQKVEESFNYIWRISRPRPISQRVSEYLAVLMVGPLLVFSAIGITATIASSRVVGHITAIEPFGLLYYMLSKLLPYLLIVGAFTFLYSFVPNTRVRWRAALGGGLFAGLLWQFCSVMFASFVASSTNYNAIYSGFAIMIFLLIWLDLGWLILLSGCQLAFYLQHPQHLAPQRVTPALSSRGTEFLTLMIMALCGRRFISGEPGYTQDELALALEAPPAHVSQMVEVLLQQNLLVESGDKQTRLIPGLDLDSIELSRLWRLARAGTTPLPHPHIPPEQSVLRLLDDSEARFESAHGNKSLRAFILEQAAGSGTIKET
ncbi:MAG: YihY/virulence factor BrkB family protein [Stenotrophobium sp.]